MEIQLDATDETHIIRTIEYWGIEKRRYPQYDHTAVIVAEDVTSRFLNVINLFNGAVPIAALQMQAFEVGEHVTLVFTKVVDVSWSAVRTHRSRAAHHEEGLGRKIAIGHKHDGSIISDYKKSRSKR